MSQRLLLPGEGQGLRLRSGLPFVAMLLVLAWTMVRATLLPAFGAHRVPIDPVLPILGAFALSGRRADAWIAAVGIGWIADSQLALGSGRVLLHAVLFTAMLMPLHGRIVLADRVVPAVGVTLCALLADGAVAVVLTLLGTEPRAVTAHLRGAGPESLQAGLATVLLWPWLRRVADPERRFSQALR